MRRLLIFGILSPAVSYLPFHLELEDTNPSSVPSTCESGCRKKEGWNIAARHPENILDLARHQKLSHLTFSTIT